MTIPNQPYVIDTPEALAELLERAGSLLVATDDGPALMWMDVNGDDWHGVRALTEDDWAAGRRALGQPAAVHLDDPGVLPLTVLWHDGMWPGATSPSLGLVAAEIAAAVEAGAHAGTIAARGDGAAPTEPACEGCGRPDGVLLRDVSGGVVHAECDDEPTVTP